MKLDELARKILSDSGCNEYTYGGEYSKNILKDLMEAYPNGLEYPYVDVANAILAMSRPEPIIRPKYVVGFDTEGTADSYGNFDTLEDAKASALDTLIEWQTQEMAEWKSFPLSEDDLEKWDLMIYNCSVEVLEYNPQTDEYDECWEPSYEEEESVGWVTSDSEKFKKMIAALND